MMIIETITSIRKEINEFSVQYISKLEEIQEKMEILKTNTERLEESSSGSWIGFHANMYFQNFEKPLWNHGFDAEWGSVKGIPQGWVEFSKEEIEIHVNTVSKQISFEEICEQLKAIITKALEIQTIIITDLSILNDIQGYEKEYSIVKEIEEHKWRFLASNLIKVMRPQQQITRDEFALQQGIKTPPHIEYLAEIMEEMSKIQGIRDLLTKANRLLRMIEVKHKYLGDSFQPMDNIQKVLHILDRFHKIVNQISQRYDNRKTISIDDEHDVQDLLKSLLKIYFEDVRKEEPVPSLAGSSTKMDFLLINQNVGIETKITRTNHKDKEIKDELIIDIANYKKHPSCKTLICFIYDPKGLIQNPNAIMELEDESSRQFHIFIKINPNTN